MPDALDPLALALLPILFGSAKAPPSGRLHPRLLGRPHPHRRLGRWGLSRVVKGLPLAVSLAASEANP